MRELPPFLRFTIAGMGIALVILAMVYGQDLLLPLSWAGLLSLLILPVQTRLEKALRYRGLAAIVSILILILIIGGVLYLLSSQVVNLVNDLPGLMRKLNLYLEELRLFIDEHLGIPYQDQPGELTGRFSAFLQESISSFGRAITSTVKTIVFIGILPIYIFFLLYYRHRFNNFFYMLYQQPGRREAVIKTVWKASTVVQKYLSGMVIVTFIVAIMVLVFFLIMGVKHALFFAILVAVLNLVPYIGVVLASTISILYVFITKDSLLYPVITFGVLWGIQLIENNLITPYIVGRQIQLNPLAVVLVIILGGMIWGVSGMVLFIPLLGGLKVILDESPQLRPFGYLLGDDPPRKGEQPE